MDWFELPVSQVEKATDDATSVTFAVPDSIRATFNWQPGQHIRLQLPIEGELLSRNYSISAPLGEPLHITVKQVKNGKGSGYINQQLKAGVKLQATPPMGSFVLNPQPQARRSYYFFSAGSGITPIYSMLVSLLNNEPNSYAYLLYGNKDGKSTIFAEQLAQLEQDFSERLVICQCHSSPSWFASSPWRSGRIDAQVVHAFIQENPPYAQDAQYYLCGPGSFLPDVKAALNAIDVPNSRIHLESFGSANGAAVAESVAAELAVNLYGQSHTVQVVKGQSLLQAMLQQGIEAPYSCEGGVCGTCRCKLTQGEVQMASNLVLDQDEIKGGEILACQSRALTDILDVQYQR